MNNSYSLPASLLATAQRLPYGDRLAKLARDYATCAVTLGFSLLAFFVIKYLLIGNGASVSINAVMDFSTLPVRAGLLLVLTLAGASIRMETLDEPIRRFLRVLIPVIVLYVFSAGPDAVAADTPHAGYIKTIIALSWAAPVIGLVAWWRPSFLLPLLTLMLWHKQLQVVLSGGYGSSATDYMPLMDALLLTLSAIGILRALSVSRFWQQAEAHRNVAGVISPLMAVFLAMIGIHLSNYFHSGTAKIFLDGGPLSWLLENRTDFLFHNTWENGMLPLAASPQLAALVAAILVPPMYLVINTLTLFPQLLCPLAAFSRRALIVALLYFDLQHTVIFVLTGIAFWKWVALNTACVIALTRWQVQRTPVPVALTMMLLSIFVLYMPTLKFHDWRPDFGGTQLFFTARLGWYDSPATNHIYLTAKLEDGRELRVPTNYFLSHSIFLAQQRQSSLVGNMFPTGTWGTTMSHEDMNLALKCELPLTSPPESGEKLQNFISFIKAHHAEILRRAGDDGKLAYNFYPHHIWSNPLLYREFAALDFRQIHSFRLTFEALCTGWSEGQRQIKPVSTQSYDIMLP